MRRFGLLAVLMLLAAPGDAAADNPWQLSCASRPAERPLPAAVQAAAAAFYPWIDHPKALHAGPVYLVALSSRTQISRDGDTLDADGYYLHRALIVIAPTLRGPVSVRGMRIRSPGRRTRLGFSTTGASRCSVSGVDVVCNRPALRFRTTLRIAAGPGWRIVRTELRIGRTGCFRIALDAPGRRHETIPLAVPGPDYGTPGW